MAIKGVIKNSVTTDISAEQFASLFESLYGINGICNIYEKLQCVKIDNNKVRLSSGVYNLSGHMVMVEKGTNEDFLIDSGTVGLKRNDLLIAEFVRNGLGTGIDALTFRILKGSSVVGAASDPELISQDISADGTTRQEALYRIMLDGTEITNVVPLANKIENINTLYPLSGGNADGNYVKFPDGTLIMSSRFNVNLNDTSVSGIKSRNFPIVPVAIYGGGHIPDYIGNVNYIDALRGLVVSVNTTLNRWEVWPRIAYEGSANINVFIIGRWK